MDFNEQLFSGVHKVIEELITKYNFEIVITSAHTYKGVEWCMKQLPPSLHSSIANGWKIKRNFTRHKGGDIQEYIDHHDITDYVIIDDQIDEFDGVGMAMRQRIALTDKNYGLTSTRGVDRVYLRAERALERTNIKTKVAVHNNENGVLMGCKPDPFKFTIERTELCNGNTIVQANYGGKTYGGSKLMVLRGIFKDFEILDPHFLGDGHQVVARFEPTDEGWGLAMHVSQKI